MLLVGEVPTSRGCAERSLISYTDLARGAAVADLMIVAGGGEAAMVRAGAVAARPFFNWIRQRLWPDISRGALQDKLEDLADKVEQDQQLLLNQMLVGRGDPLELRIRTGSPGESENARFVTMPDLDDDIVDGTLPRRIVVVGEPGAGKTVFGIRLLLTRLQRRNALPSDGARSKSPVPVRFTDEGDRKRRFSFHDQRLTGLHRLRGATLNFPSKRARVSG